VIRSAARAAPAAARSGGRLRHFAVLSVERRHELDLSALEARYKDLSRKLHPDRFARARPARAARVAAAYGAAQRGLAGPQGPDQAGRIFAPSSKASSSRPTTAARARGRRGLAGLAHGDPRAARGAGRGRGSRRTTPGSRGWATSCARAPHRPWRASPRAWRARGTRERLECRGARARRAALLPAFSRRGRGARRGARARGVGAWLRRSSRSPSRGQSRVKAPCTPGFSRARRHRSRDDELARRHGPTRQARVPRGRRRGHLVAPRSCTTQPTATCSWAPSRADSLRARLPRRHDRLGEALHGPRAARRRGHAEAHAARLRAPQARATASFASPSRVAAP